MPEQEPTGEEIDFDLEAAKIQGEEPKIDLDFYKETAEVLAGEPTLITALRPASAREERGKFLAGEIVNPQFEYERTMDESRFKERMNRLNRLEQKVEAGSNSVVNNLYQAKIESTREELLMRTSIGRDPANFSQASRWLFGIPTEEAYKLALEERAQKQEKDKPEKEQLLGAEEIAQVFNRAIEEIHINKPLAGTRIHPWEAIIHPSAAAITIDRKFFGGPKIKIPPKREVSINKLEELVQHEIVTHLGRGSSGQLSKLALIGFLGAAGSSTAEEGLSTYLEQEAAKFRGREPKNAGLNGTIAIGAALLEGRNFRETYEFLRSLGYSEKTAYGQTNRVFRGISDTSRRDGKICTIDWSYRAGNIAIAEFVNTYGEGEFNRLWIGKIGPSHLGMMTELGIDKPALPRRFLKIEDLMAGRD